VRPNRPADAKEDVDVADPTQDDGSDVVDERTQRLVAGLARVRAERAGFDHRVLAVAAGVLVPVGLVLVLVGWRGASRTPNVYEQIPYLISGAELGQTLAVVGALCWFGYLLTTLVREHRDQTASVLDALDRVATAIERLAPAAAAEGRQRLVATARGRLAHLPTCSMVAGREGLRTVTPADGLAPCQVCLPNGGES
jgi:hypothetical protein